ncbi:MAG TPA: CvpA family protein [Flavitalea sp.]|nr:CvpA family protein [Flavitalea sp.]
MLIDVVYGILLLIALFKGLRRGLIVAIFSLLAFIIGLAAAMKLSVMVAGYLEGATNIGTRWLPFISFLLIFISVALIVRWAARLMESATNALSLGWFNKLGGVALYCVLYTFCFSVVLFYGNEMGLLAAKSRKESICYQFVAPLGPYVIGKLAILVPAFSDLFSRLTTFFGRLAE